MADMLELIARLEAAEAGSRELDREIGEVTRAPMGNAGDVVGLGYAHFTTSLDAALALAERVVGEACALDVLQDVMSLHDAEAISIRDLPRLICIAILKAKAQGEGG